MLEIELKDLSLGFGERTLFAGAGLSIYTGDKIGLVGANGCGKTTLLRTIVSAERPEAITVAKSLSIGYLEQQLGDALHGTVLEIATEACRNLLDMERELESLTEQMSQAEPDELNELGELYSRLHDEFEARDGYSVHSRILGVLRGMGLSDEFFPLEASVLSGGEKARLAISRLLLSNHDVLLLDEPTNHLDLRAAQWLTEFLCTLKSTVVVVSHDRYLLDRLCGGIAEIADGRMTFYKGNYTAFRNKTGEQKRLKQKQYDEQQQEIKRQQGIIKQYRAFNREKSIRAAESREKALERMDKVEAPEQMTSMRLMFKDGPRPGSEALVCAGFGVGYPDKPLLFGNDITVMAGARICLVGSNGCGKTTLLRALLGRLEHEGTVKWGTNIVIGYYDQHHQELTGENTVLDEIWLADRKLSQTQVRSAAAAMLFTGEDVFKRICTLSGGEKARVALCKLALSGCNVLIMDEPTNHLDMPSREILEEALESFDGTVICVSHDRYFINRIAEQVWEIKEKRLIRFDGNYDAYAAACGKSAQQEAPPVNKTAEAKKRAQERAERERLKELRTKRESMEREIAALEKEIAALEQLFSGTEIYSDAEALRQKQSSYIFAKQQLDMLYEEWLTIGLE